VSLTFAPFSTNYSDPMPLWAQTLLTLAALALMLALVAAVWALRRVAQRAAGVLTIVEEELRPLVGQAHALTEDVRALTRAAGRELERIGVVAEEVESDAGGFGRVVGVVPGLGRVRSVVGGAARGNIRAAACGRRRPAARGRHGRDARGNQHGLHAGACMSSSGRTPRSSRSGARSGSAGASPSRRRSTPWSWRSRRSGGTTR